MINSLFSLYHFVRYHFVLKPFDQLLWHSCMLHHSPHSIMPYAVDCLFEVCEVDEDILVAFYIFSIVSIVRLNMKLLLISLIL